MSSEDPDAPEERTATAPQDVGGADLPPLELADVAVLQRLRDLVDTQHRVYAQLLDTVTVFDRRGLCHDDGFKTTKAWLRACLGLSGAAADRLVKTARLLRQLPALAQATRGGQVSPDHLHTVVRLADTVGTEAIKAVDHTLATASTTLDVSEFQQVCQRIHAHLDPDGPDPAAHFARRGLTLSPQSPMTALRGQLDPEGAAALSTALDALMSPPGPDDPRTPAQRRADALVELARRQLAGGDLPTVAGQRPQVGVLLFPQALSPQTLERLAQAQRDSYAAQRLREFIHTDPDATALQPDPADIFGRTTAAMRAGLPNPDPADTAGTADAAGTDTDTADAAGTADPDTVDPDTAGTESTPEPANPQAATPAAAPANSAAAPDSNPTSDPRGDPDGPPRGEPRGGPRNDPRGEPGRSPHDDADSRPGSDPSSSPDSAKVSAKGRITPAGSVSWDDPPWLDWVGAITAETAQRLACDADIWRVILDPATSMPLDVGRAHRLVPHWIRKALHTRDRGCRWPGCHTPAPWTDAHHLDPWAEQGTTTAHRCVLLCRYHHTLVHEGRWRIHLHTTTGELTITRPDGSPYHAPRTRSMAWSGPSTRRC